jgi:hypothetical protein
LTFYLTCSSFPYMNSLSSVTPQLLRRAADVQEHILKLQDELASILCTITSAEAPEKPKRKVSDAARATMRPAKKERWATVERKAVTVASTSTSAPQAERLVTSKKPAAAKTGMTFKEAILKVLASREAMHKKVIAAQVAQLRGEKPKPETIKSALKEMKKSKSIIGFGKGLYKIR